MPPKVVIDEAVRLAHWFGGPRAPAFVNGVLDRVARDLGRLVAAPVKILLVNWQDLRNPQAGGAEIHLFEIFSRLAARGHRVRLVCSGWAGARRVESVDGIEVHRVGGRHTLRAGGAARRCGGRSAASAPDVLVEDINKLPLFTPGLTRRPVCAIVPHLFGAHGVPGGRRGRWPRRCGRRSAPIPRAYRAPGSTRSARAPATTWWRAACAADRIAVDPSRRRSRATIALIRRSPRGDPPRFVYVGRLKRYKGVDVAAPGAGAGARRAAGPQRSTSRAAATTGRRLEAAGRDGSGLAERGAVSRLRRRGHKLALLRQARGRTCFRRPRKGGGSPSWRRRRAARRRSRRTVPGLRDSVRDGETGLLVPHGDVRGAGRQRCCASPATRRWSTGSAGARRSPSGSTGTAPPRPRARGHRPRSWRRDGFRRHGPFSSSLRRTRHAPNAESDRSAPGRHRRSACRR